MIPPDEGQIVGVGPTDELSLRVSVATLARVIFSNPENGGQMLALEHKATLMSAGQESRVVVRAQPFGGAVRILNPGRLQALLNGFHYDSQRSQAEQDLRLFIRPADWPVLREFCLRNFEAGPHSDLESDPSRELVEEFDDALGILLRPEQYTVKPAGVLVEDQATPSENVHATGLPTVRIYRLFEVQISDPALCRAMIANSESYPSHLLRDQALVDAQQGGRGRANAMLVTPMEQIRSLANSPDLRTKQVPYQGALLSGNVFAILDSL